MPYPTVQLLEYHPEKHKTKKDMQVTAKPYCVLQAIHS